MNEVSQAASHFIAENFNYILSGIGLLLAAAVMSMPDNIPNNLQDLWTWARETLQTAIPVKRPINHNPQPPADPGK
ncbi:MAG TPA: hypothetical protein VFW94_24360 [Candidatus Acidoferrales bacterium]|nr:hypothetical protein [Candidatus Acidoferrales bacterium]